MRLNHILTAGVLIGASCFTVGAAEVATRYSFAQNTPLANGHWVRITVPETGMYEISYDQLRSMGFSDPSKVGVYGRGGAALDFNFISSSGNKIYQDTPQQVPVLHTGDKVIFYGTGPETVKATSSISDFEIKYTRDARNIYADAANYLLSDVEPVKAIEDMSVSDSSALATVTKVYSYSFHEIDLTQGTHASGQVFYGEPLVAGSPLSFEINQPYAKNQPVYLQTRYAMGQGGYGKLSMSIGDGSQSITISSPSSASMKDIESNFTSLKLENNAISTLKFDIDAGYGTNLLALDWWIATYPIDLSSMSVDKNLTQMRMAFKSAANNEWKFQVPRGAMAWQINKSTNPQALKIDDNSFALGISESTVNELIVFNPNTGLKQISDWKAIENQNLHAYQNEGIELLIFSTTDMLPYANRIAAAHEKYDGIKCLVVTPEQIYNEFNYGTEDPAAYRAIAKMFFHNTEKPLKNVLFLGKMTGDNRNLRKSTGFTESHIAYQEATTKPNDEAICIMDYYGCLTDYVSYPTSLVSVPISVGVGLLPVSTYEEASNVTAKIEDYLSRQDYSNIVNETMLIACEGDQNLHDMQAVDYSTMMQQLQDKYYGSKYSHYFLRFDGLTEKIIRDQFRSTLERGKVYSMYFGHGTDYGLNGGKLGINDLMTLENNELTFQFMAACDLCSPDQGHQGMGDVGVTRARKGFIGSIVGTRSVMSNENETLARSFYNSLYFKNGVAQKSNLRTEPITVGEAYAISKSNETSASQQAFLLIGDPAITLPIALGKVELEVTGQNVQKGDLVEVKGRVLDNNSNEINKEYNGYATVKLMRPAIACVLPTKYPLTDINYSTDITDLRLTTVQAEVKNGEFKVYVPVPDKVNEFMSSSSETVTLPIYAATYDPSTKLGCSGISSTTVGIDGADRDPDAITDNVKPTVNLAYDNLMQTITLDVSDNVAILPGVGTGSGVTFVIDEKSYQVASPNSSGVATTSYSTKISTAHLAPGDHNAMIYAVDLAGNQSERKRLTFKVGSTQPMVLEAKSTYAIDEITFNIQGMGDEACMLVMTDLDGKTVYKGDANGNEVTCDVSDLKPGIYRASVRHDSPKGALLYSNWVEFTVID